MFEILKRNLFFALFSVVFMTADLAHVNVDFAFGEIFFFKINGVEAQTRFLNIQKILEGNAQYSSCCTFLY